MTQSAASAAKWTPRAERLIHGAEGWSSRLGHSYIGTEHLLLSMLDDPDGIAGEVLASSLGTEAVRAAVLDAIERAAQITQTSVAYPVGFPREKRLTRAQLDADGLVEAPDYEP
jgi:ATP-dependent Clp protease ATP-binding subunit ClpA